MRKNTYYPTVSDNLDLLESESGSMGLRLNEIWFNEENTHYDECNDSGEEDPTCSNSCSPIHCTSVSDHLHYMNITMGSDGTC